jgi:FPC/CPF motif-containing protein YcgG
LSVDKNISKEALYNFLKDLYFETKKELIDNVKNHVDSILFNFSSEESNIINQYNYLVKNKKDISK